MALDQWRFLVVRDLWGRTVHHEGGDRIGIVAATVRRADDGIDLLVRGRRGRVARIPLDSVSVDSHGGLWLRPVLRVVRPDPRDHSPQPSPAAVGGVPLLPFNGRPVELSNDCQGLG